MTNREWIMKGNTGCTFATLFSKNPSIVGWRFYDPIQWVYQHHYEELSLIVSIEFPNDGFWCKSTIKSWALSHGFYIEDTSETTEGLRIKCKNGVSWVQYFGPDSHVKTRQSPSPMLMYTNKLGKSYYVKVGFHGILHLAHAWYDKINEKVYDLLWSRSYEQTKKKLGKSPDIISAAKTTWLKTD